jgi:hypothetical protein
MEEVTDPVLIESFRQRRTRFDRNWAWFQQHIADICNQHRGRCLAVAGRELFVADTPQEVLALARAAHPEDDGMFTWYVPRERMPRVYAHRRRVVPVQ